MTNSNAIREVFVVATTRIANCTFGGRLKDASPTNCPHSW